MDNTIQLSTTSNALNILKTCYSNLHLNSQGSCTLYSNTFFLYQWRLNYPHSLQNQVHSRMFNFNKFLNWFATMYTKTTLQKCYRLNLGAFTTDTTSQLNIFRHDCDTFGMNRTQVCILEQPNKICFTSLL